MKTTLNKVHYHYELMQKARLIIAEFARERHADSEVSINQRLLEDMFGRLFARMINATMIDGKDTEELEQLEIMLDTTIQVVQGYNLEYGIFELEPGDFPYVSPETPTKQNQNDK